MIFRMPNRLRFRNYRLSSKLILVYVLLTVIPMSLLGYLSYIQYTKSIEEQIGEYMPRFLSQTNAMITKQMQEYTELSGLLFNSDQILSILRRDSYQSQSDLNKDQYAVNNYLARTYIDSGNPDIIGVFIISHSRLFHSTRIKYTGLDIESNMFPYGTDLDLRGKARVVLPSEMNLKFENNEPYIMIMQQINDVDNRRILATMLVVVQLSFIDRIVKEYEINHRGNLWLMNREGEIIYHNDPAKIGDFDQELARYPILNGSFRKGTGSDTVIYSLSESRDFDWVLAHSIELKYLTERTDFTRNVTIFIFICLAIITSSISIFFVLKVTNPLKRLSRLMKKVELGRLQVDLQHNSQDEIGALARSFNSMVATMRELIEKNYDIKLRQKEAELYALQSQINPHFMYNTLETINMAVDEGRTEMVVNMVTLLGRMLRFSVTDSSRFVPIVDEVQHIRDYLTIQGIRFGDRLQFEIELKTEIGNLYTPKFILQPVIENSIKYGLELRKKLKIRVSISKEFGARTGKEDIVLRIWDDGPGIHPDRLEALEQEIRSETLFHKDSGFGLSNVNARIGIMLGDGYGLQLHSIYGKGTEVIIRIPELTIRDVSEHPRIKGE